VCSSGGKGLKSNEAMNAADAFRWWFEQNHLIEIPEHGG
jgi:hypothetical protein